MPSHDDVKLADRGMLVVSVARRLGSEGPLPAYCAARSNRAGPEKGAESAKLTIPARLQSRRQRVN